MDPAAVVQHLLFHRALLGDREDGLTLNRYIAMVGEIAKGLPLGLDDPVERSIAAAFELTLEERMDPWAIDLVQFVQLYLEKVQGEGRVDFITAGRLILMAWSVLRMQSDGVVELADPAPTPEDLPFLDWELGADGGLGSAPGDPLRVHGPPLARALRHTAPRPVTLMDLVTALREAEHRLTPKPRRHPDPPTPAEVQEKIHGEELTTDLEVTWARIVALGEGEFPLEAIWPQDHSEGVAVFISLLFLARVGWVALHQPDLAVDRITIEVLGPPDANAMEEATNLSEGMEA